MKLMSGNDAVARGAWEAGVGFASGYPGTPSTEVLERLARYDEVDAHWSTNEKVAFEEAMGAALGGVRSMVTMKHVGLNVAADPFMVFPYAGTNAGFVVLVADDPGMYSSQNEQDSRYFAKVAKVLPLPPAAQPEALDRTRGAFDRYERRLATRDPAEAARRRTTLLFLRRVVVAIVAAIAAPSTTPWGTSTSTSWNWPR